jgi:broad specificity phosphatase PhoE
VAERRSAGDRAVLLVGHGGWITALVHLPAGADGVDAAHWPAAPRHGALVRWPAPDATHPG